MINIIHTYNEHLYVMTWLIGNVKVFTMTDSSWGTTLSFVPHPPTFLFK